MNAETLRKAGVKALFGEALFKYRDTVWSIVEGAQDNKDLGDPQTVLDCLSELRQTMVHLDKVWFELMLDERSDDDDLG